MMHQAGVLRGWNLEDCMETAFGLLGWFIWVVHQATVNAGPTLARIIQESTTELNNRALELIECTILHGPAYSEWFCKYLALEQILSVLSKNEF